MQDVRYEHAVALAKSGRHDEALQVADQLWAAHPEVVDYAALRAQIQSDRGDVTAALAHMDARLDALPVEARTEGAHAMAHARAHYGALLQTGMAAMDEHDKTDAVAELEALQRRSLLIEDAWVSARFGQIWVGLGDHERAMPLLEHAVQLSQGDARTQASARVQRGRLLVELERHPEALTDFQLAFAARDDWDAPTWLAAEQAALGMGQRETALGWFERARSLEADKGSTRGLFAKTETALKATRPKWKLWGV